MISVNCSQRFFLWAAIAFIIISYTKGINLSLSPWGAPYFQLNYSDGIIKRAFIGEILSWLPTTTDVNRLHQLAVYTHFFLSAALVFALLELLRQASTQDSKRDLPLWLATFALAASQFWPHLAQNPGLLDIYIYLLFVAALLCHINGRIWPAAFIAIISPLIHESAIFVWLPLAVLVGWDCWKIRAVAFAPLALLVAIALSTLAILLLHNQAAAIAQLQATGLDEGITHHMVTSAMQQTFHSSIHYMFGVWQNHFANGLISLFFFSLPAFIILAIYFSARRITALECLVLSAAAFAPTLILLFAWDISRFVALTTLTSWLSILYWGENTLQRRAHYTRMRFMAQHSASPC